MAHSVSGCVLSIVASFASGLDVCKKLRDNRRSRKHGRTCHNIDSDERRLTKSLRQGSEDVGREYQRNMQAAGDDFARGDAIAQTSLAEILLKLNTGLVGIIASFVNRDGKDVQLDYQSMTLISEASRVNTCKALRQLCRRMLRPPKPLSVTQSTDKLDNTRKCTAREDSNLSGRRKKKSPSNHPKLRGPVLARVTIQNSSKPSQLALVRSRERRQATSHSSSRRASDTSKSHSPSSTPPPAYTAHETTRPDTRRSKTQPEISTREQSSRSSPLNTSSNPPLPPKSEPLRPSHSAPRLPTLQSPDSHPKKSPTAPSPAITSARLFSSDTLPLQPRHRKPTPTYYSTASDGTKLGEIPLHHWPVPYDFDQMSIVNREAAGNGWPANQLESGSSEQQQRKGKKGFWRLFGRKSVSS